MDGDEVTVLLVPSRLEESTILRPMRWRRMAWVVWRQHRIALGGAAALMGGLVVWIWIAGRQLHHAHAAATACHPASSFACTNLVNSFNGMTGVLANGYALQAVPALIGAFVGAPVLARELETGTFRHAWTQGFERWRWALAKLIALAVTLSAAAGGLSVLLSWYYQPILATGNQTLGLNEASPLARGLFDLRGVAFAAWTLAAFAIGALAGMLIRRVVPAIVATLAAYSGLALVTGLYLRQHYLRPVITTSLDLPASAWTLSRQWLSQSGQQVSRSELVSVLQSGQVAGKGGVPQSLGAWQYLVHHGYTLRTTFQPASRFWAFQWIEGGWLLAVSVLLIALTVLVVRRRAA